MTAWRINVEVRIGAFELDVALGGDDAPVALIGPNGSGKTTLLRLIAGAVAPSEGEIVIGDSVLFSARRGIDLAPEARRVGYVPQGYGLFPHLRVIDNVAFGLSTGSRRLPRSERHQAARAALSELAGCELADRFPRHLSGGEQQRVALARALVIEPAILLLDEPLAALDVGARRSVRQFLAERLRALKRPTLVVTHDARDVAALEARVCVLDSGRVVQQGSLDDLRANPSSAFVAEFVEGVAPMHLP